MKRNEELQKDVQAAISWEPLLNAAEIGVTAKDGVITLSGTVDTYAKKLEAEKAAKGVTGVQAVVENIEVRFGHSFKKEDDEIAREVITALKNAWEVPHTQIMVKVEKGYITLDGSVEWNFQREAATVAVKHLPGVKNLINRIAIKSSSNDVVEKEAIKRALLRNSSINDEDIHVEVSNSLVTLRGSVDSYYEKTEAARMAWNAPGVTSVNNELEIEYAGYLV